MPVHVGTPTIVVVVLILKRVQRVQRGLLLAIEALLVLYARLVLIVAVLFVRTAGYPWSCMLWDVALAEVLWRLAPLPEALIVPARVPCSVGWRGVECGVRRATCGVRRAACL